MLLWIVFAFMTCAALLAILVPLGRGKTDGGPGRPAIAIYRDQLRMIESDIDKGLLDKKEAEAARTEISRRLLAQADADKGDLTEAAVAPRSTRSAAFMAAFVVFLTLGGYLTLGSPQLQGQPAAERQSQSLERQELAALVARVEAHLLKNPRDGDGWQIVAPAYMRLREFAKAAHAFSQAIEILGPSGERYGGYGEALTLLGNGLVSEESRKAFEKAVELKPDLVRPRFFLGIAHEQDQNWQAAAEAWRALLAGSPPQAPYRPLLETKLASAQALAAAGAQPAPTAEDVRRAQSLSAGERQEMIAGMVAGLAVRLEQDGNDIEGWLRLIRSYVVLGRPDDAKASLIKARANFSNDTQALSRIDMLARDLDIAHD